MDETPILNYFNPFYLFYLLIALMLFYILKSNHFLKIHRWQKRLNLKKHRQAFNQLYRHVDGFKLSQQARQHRNAIEYTYGEINFLSFIALLSLVKPHDKTIFYDLGSGVGKAVIACAMVYPIQKSVGVELFPEMHDAACNQASQLAIHPDYTSNTKKIDFILGDFLELDLQDATLIFINSTTIIGSSWKKLCTRINNLPHLDTVITTSKALEVSHFSLVKTTQVQMSWGIVLAYIHTRKTIFHLPA